MNPHIPQIIIDNMGEGHPVMNPPPGLIQLSPESLAVPARSDCNQFHIALWADRRKRSNEYVESRCRWVAKTRGISDDSALMNELRHCWEDQFFRVELMKTSNDPKSAEEQQSRYQKANRTNWARSIALALSFESDIVSLKLSTPCVFRMIGMHTVEHFIDPHTTARPGPHGCGHYATVLMDVLRNEGSDGRTVVNSLGFVETLLLVICFRSVENLPGVHHETMKHMIARAISRKIVRKASSKNKTIIRWEFELVNFTLTPGVSLENWCQKWEQFSEQVQASVRMEHEMLLHRKWKKPGEQVYLPGTLQYGQMRQWDQPWSY
ncbi:hypothetical protein C8R43DRAFT_1141563 [Mycena crocata]|nr:hypothetical protein C8R43DRAFT_1141563 [Mycena crocata]